MFKLIIRGKSAAEEMRFNDWVAASDCRDACRATIRMSMPNIVGEVYDKERNAFILKCKDAYVELIISKED